MHIIIQVFRKHSDKTAVRMNFIKHLNSIQSSIFSSFNFDRCLLIPRADILKFSHAPAPCHGVVGSRDQPNRSIEFRITSTREITLQRGLCKRNASSNLPEITESFRFRGSEMGFGVCKQTVARDRKSAEVARIEKRGKGGEVIRGWKRQRHFYRYRRP